MKLHKYGWLPRSPTRLVALYASELLHRGIVGEDKWAKVNIYICSVYWGIQWLWSYGLRR